MTILVWELWSCSAIQCAFLGLSRRRKRLARAQTDFRLNDAAAGMESDTPLLVTLSHLRLGYKPQLEVQINPMPMAPGRKVVNTRYHCKICVDAIRLGHRFLILSDETVTHGEE